MPTVKAASIAMIYGNIGENVRKNSRAASTQNETLTEKFSKNLCLTSSPRLKPGDSQGRTPVYKKIGSNMAVLLRRHATLILEGHVKSPLDSCSKSNFCLLFLRMFAAPLRSAFALRPSLKR